MAENDDKERIAEKNWNRYEYVRGRGHGDYITQAKKCEGFYLGGGLQYSAADRTKLEGEGKPVIEVNTVMPAINIALGYQLSHRADIAFKPRGGGADQDGADRMTKVVKQIADMEQLHWKESQVFGDGVIEQRGYFDLRINYNDNINGNVELDSLDPLDVIPDPDSNSYDPDDWKDVTIVRWLALDDIKQLYGEKIAKELEEIGPVGGDGYGYGEGGEDEDGERNKFGDLDPGGAASLAEFTDGKSLTRYKVVDRQYWRYELSEVYIYPTGDVKIIPDAAGEDERRIQVEQYAASITKRLQRRVRWTVSTRDVVLHDDWSPYRHFTVVPFFAYFRRGKTRGGIDNLIGPQELLNKTVSQILHIVNTTANSGWNVEEDSLTNMTTEDLERDGAKSGLVIERKKNAAAPEKIKPNQVPTGISELATKAEWFIKVISGMSDAMQGLPGKEVSGRAKDSMKMQGVIQLAVILDNLAYTRRLLTTRLLDLVQGFIKDERVYMITDESDVTGTQHYPLVVNQYTEDGILNDLTAGEYDFVIDEKPTQVTFNETQFEEAMDLRNAGIRIPDQFIIAHSSLNKKNEILQAMKEAGQPPEDPEKTAKAELITAQRDKTRAEATREKVQATIEALRGAEAVAVNPQLAALGDELLRSAGFDDANGGSAITPQPGALAEAPEGEVEPAAKGVPPVPLGDAQGVMPEQGMMEGV